MPYLLLLVLIAILPSASAASTPPLFKTLDLKIGEEAKVKLPDGSQGRIQLISVKEYRGDVWGEIYRAEVIVEVDGQRTTLVSGMYNLPKTIGKIQIDSPITGGLKDNSHINHWQLDKDARLRIWPKGSPWIQPDTFVYPVKQKWFASQTSFSNEPVAPRPRRQLYYHSGLDIGGAEGMTEIVAATDALIVSLGNQVLPGHEKDTPIEKRYDVIYLLDSRGWYYRYSHLHSFDPSLNLGARIKIGRRLGLIGKEGGSGGWTHLHFEIKNRQPSGRWGTEDGYAFLWQSYLRQYQPKLVAVARPSHVVFVNQPVHFDATKSWSVTADIKSYQWIFPDGATVTGPTTSRVFDSPGTYFATLQVKDGDGRIAYDFVRAKVFDPKNRDQQPPRLHLAYHPTLNLKSGTEITFKARSFYFTHGEEIWDFGDGSSKIRTKSDGNVVQLAKDGYVSVRHRYKLPGDYLVHVKRFNEHGHLAEDRLHLRIEK